MSSKGFKRTEFIFKTIMKHFSDKELRDNLKIQDLIEAISRATTRATIVYANGNHLLSGIEQQFKEHTPQILPEDGYSKTEKDVSFLGGSDALSYLSFQRALIKVLSIVALSSMVIVLSLNIWCGTTLKNNVFAVTTLSNLDPGMDGMFAGILKWLFSEHEIPTRWYCLFLPENDAFYVNYMIQFLFIETAMDLIRFKEIEYSLRIDSGRVSFPTAEKDGKSSELRNSEYDVSFLGGSDALSYLNFQTALIKVPSIVALSSMVIVLPLNIWCGTTLKNNLFAVTTLTNLGQGSPYVGVHTLLAITFFITVACIMKNHVEDLYSNEFGSPLSVTLMISNLNAKCRHYAYDYSTTILQNELEDHFKKAYPDILVKEISVVHDTQEVAELVRKR
ncbi:hypothetical protein QYM36_013871 [Artemia franciscana]|uniref:Uncharacterized protein n=1 Tax=Artemia franciscana TaxID=6661 RepID=A0AA88HE50_ARTSF|nr:hypothetical protein QYM36_013871 [Artemia franciscana]